MAGADRGRRSECRRRPWRWRFPPFAAKQSRPGLAVPLGRCEREKFHNAPREEGGGHVVPARRGRPAPRRSATPTDGEGGRGAVTEPEEVPPPPEEGVPGIPGIADEDPLTGELAEDVEVPDTDASPSEARDDANLTSTSLSRTFADLDDDAQLVEVLEKLEWGLPPRSFDARLGVTVRGPERWDEVLAWMASDAECSRYAWTRTAGAGTFQLAAREGCGDALANMHVNCIDKTPAAGASPTPPRGKVNPNAAPRGIRRRLCGARRVQHASPHRHRMGEPRPRDVTGDHQVRQASHRPHDPRHR